MKQILVVEASHNYHATGSRHVATLIEEKLRSKYPEAKYIRHDLAAKPLPHLKAATVQAFFTPTESQSSAQKEAVQLSDELTAELLDSNLLVLSMPMWNFNIPSSVKSWIDHVVRSGVTFKYSQAGVQGFAGATRAILVVASGGIFSEGPMSAWDYLVPYVAHILNFIGIQDIQVLRVEGTVPAPQDAMTNAIKAVDALVL
jgi:FMN-dependent NADH-azoreductase